MKYIVDTALQLSELNSKIKAQYIISSQHRKTKKSHKSYWTISYKEEVECFCSTFSEKWIEDYEGWGLKVENSNIIVLGQSKKKTDLKLAKFVDGNQNDIWHGYPADHLEKTQDIPPIFILKLWKEKGYISKADVLKIK